MTLKEYFKSGEMSLRLLGAKIGRSHTTLSSLRDNPESVRLYDARKIEEATNGKVTLNDW